MLRHPSQMHEDIRAQITHGLDTVICPQKIIGTHLPDIYNLGSLSQKGRSDMATYKTTHACHRNSNHRSFTPIPRQFGNLFVIICFRYDHTHSGKFSRQPAQKQGSPPLRPRTIQCPEIAINVITTCLKQDFLTHGPMSPRNVSAAFLYELYVHLTERYLVWPLVAIARHPLYKASSVRATDNSI